MVIRFAFRLMLIALACAPASAVRATGMYLPELRFFSRTGQDPEDNLAYFRGRIGILRPTMDDNRLYAAYRLMTGRSFTDAQAQQLLAECCGADADDAAFTGWTDIRKRVLAKPSANNNLPMRQGLDSLCLPNAYRVAATTLKARIAEHGADDPSVHEWAAGQDAVFLNCQSDGPLPAEVPNAPDWLKADRAYQIAAAYFYRNDHTHAGALFAEIGRDASSPWRKTARYLVARAAAHAAMADKTAENIAAAERAIAAVATDAELAEYRDGATHLASMLAYNTRPRERALELEKSLMADDLPVTLAVDARDFEWLERSGERYSELGAWIYDVDALLGEASPKKADAKADALRRWSETKSLPWLVAAMMWLDPGDAQTAEAIAASREIAATSPAYHTLAWHRLRLLIDAGKNDDARAELDQLLASPNLPAGVENLYRYHRLKLARDLGEFEKFALRRAEFLKGVYDPRTKLSAISLPLSGEQTGYMGAILNWRKELYAKNPLYFDTDATLTMAFYMPLPMMAKLASSAALPPHLKRDLALAVWTRAVLLDDGDTAHAMAAVAAPFFPQFADGWRSYRGAGGTEARKAEAALLMLRLPAARPWPDWGPGYMFQRDRIGLFGPRWWVQNDNGSDSLDADSKPIVCTDCALPLTFAAPPFLTKADRERAQKENERLRELPGAPTYLGATVIPWAKAHANDPRVPEALHLVVRATQYGDHDSDTSKAAYDLLHNRFPRNPWTAKTPLWF